MTATVYDPCPVCHGDPAHESWCPDAVCWICRRPTCDGNCADRAYDNYKEEL